MVGCGGTFSGAVRLPGYRRGDDRHTADNGAGYQPDGNLLLYIGGYLHEGPGIEIRQRVKEVRGRRDGDGGS